jgi:phosphinothricin acetyltransferase
MLIRDANPQRDAAPCAAIYAPYVEETAITFEEIAPDERALAARIEHTTRSHPWLVALDGQEVVGFAHGSQHRARPAYRWAADVSVYVAPGRQRQGIGRALYEALFGHLAGQGLHVACAGITLPNEASVGIHEALGFTPVGVYRRIGYKLGSWRDVGWWQLELLDRGTEPPAQPRPPQASELPAHPGSTARIDR